MIQQTAIMVAGPHVHRHVPLLEIAHALRTYGGLLGPGQCGDQLFWVVSHKPFDLKS